MAHIIQTGKKPLYVGLNYSFGFTYIGLLVFIAISGIGMAGVGITWKHTIQTAREKELLFIGNEYRKAIESYYENGPNGIKNYPKTVDELLVDKRFPTLKRHLRKIYLDPFKKNKQLSFVKIQDQIMGVYSATLLEPIKKKNFAEAYKHFEKAKSYQDWTFTYTPYSPNGLFKP